jgi:tRNA (guanine-N7-)-methyltransferase
MTAERDFRFYGRRHGRPLRASRRRLIETALPKLRIAAAAPLSSLTDLFDDPVDRVWIEIGFGAGEHLAGLIRAHPQTGFIGCEPFVNGNAALLAALDAGDPDRRPRNLRLFPDDVRLLLPLLPAASVERIYTMFPDPWPKTRHHRRRLIAAETLDQFARTLRPGGLFRMASDHMGYIRWTLAEVLRHGAYAWLAEGPADWRRRFDDSPPTRYEEKALKQGRACVYLDFCLGAG